ncbi:polysaccharide deacetylase family protein [Chryseobacterium sp.]|uniref:polysaccharide deacetylase family protein n=1 Tax=Chryseobacterium sp. TaxID=1871047 RepID=UPI00388D5B1C
MKNYFEGKSKGLTFLGLLSLMSATSLLSIGCNGKDELYTITRSTSEQEIIHNTNKVNDSTKNVIYLTFDDGPNKGTANLIKILNKRKVSATAFLIGVHGKASLQQKKDLEDLKKDTLIEFANHSYSHAHNKFVQFYRNPLAVVQDFDRAKDSLKLSNNIARTPGRNIWRLNNINRTDLKSSNDAANGLQKAGYKVIGWDLEWRHSKKMGLSGNHQAMIKKVDSLFNNNLTCTPKHLVFLTHDQYLSDQDSMRELDLFIEELQKTNRFVFRKISAYPKINDVYN